MRLRLLLGISILWLPLAFLSDGLTALVLPIQLSATTHGDAATVLGIVTFVALGSAVAIQPIAGTLADLRRDQMDRRNAIALAAVLVAIALAVFGLASTVVLVAASYLAVQVTASVVQAGQQSLIPEHVPSPGRGFAAGIKSAFDIGGSVAAFLVLGAVLATAGASAAVLLVGVLLAASVAAMCLLVPPSVNSDRAAATLRGRLPDGFARLVLIRFLFLVGTYAVGRFLLLFVAARLETDAAQAAKAASALLALLTLVSAVAAIPLGALADRFGREGLMAAGVVVSAAGIIVLTLPAGIAPVIGGGLLMSLGTAAFVPANWAATTDLAPAADSGRLMGLANIGTGGAAACAGLLGPVIDAVGFGPSLGAAALVTLLALVPLIGERATEPLDEVAD